MTKRKSALINENVARRWGKLANMPSLTENWLDTLNEDDPAEEEEEAMDDMDKAALGDDPEAEMDYAEGDLERADDAEGGDLAGVLETDEAQELVAGIASHVASVLGIDVDIDMDGEDEEVEDVVDLDDMDPGMHDDPAMGMNPRNRDDELDEKQGYDDREDEAESARLGAIGSKDVSKKGRRDDSRGKFGKRDKEHRKGKAMNRTDEKQGYDDREDEAESARLGAIGSKDVSKKGRRDDSRGKFGKRDKEHRKGKAMNRNDETLDIDVVDDEALTEAVLKRVVERLLSNK